MKVSTPEEWLAARKSLLQKEKDMTRAQAALAQERRQMPIYPVTKTYNFTASDGSTRTLSDLFDGRRQLLVQHFMFDPAHNAGCNSCSYVADNLPHPSHLRSRDTNLVFVSRAPIEKINAFKQRMGWQFPWYSSNGEDFNYDFHSTSDDSKAPVYYNFSTKEELLAKGRSSETRGEQPGVSCFILGKAGEEGQVDGQIYHANSTYGVGLDQFLVTYALLDQTPLGRGEEEMEKPGVRWFKHHDRYDDN